MTKEEIKKLSEEKEWFKNWYLMQNGTKSVEKAFKKQKYNSLRIQKFRKEEEKIKSFENKDNEYLSTLLKKLKKIFNKAKKDKDLKQLKYLNQKIGNLIKDKNYFRKSFNGGCRENKICHDFCKIRFEVHKMLRDIGE